MDRAVAPVSSCTQQHPGSQPMFHIAWSRWLRSLRNGLSGKSRQRKTARPVLLRCEPLEDRCLPSSFGDLLYSTAALHVGNPVSLSDNYLAAGGYTENTGATASG